MIENAYCGYDDAVRRRTSQTSPPTHGANLQLKKNNKISLGRMDDIEEIEDELESRKSLNKGSIQYGKSIKDRDGDLISKKGIRYAASI